MVVEMAWAFLFEYWYHRVRLVVVNRVSRAGCRCNFCLYSSLLFFFLSSLIHHSRLSWKSCLVVNSFFVQFTHLAVPSPLLSTPSLSIFHRKSNLSYPPNTMRSTILVLALSGSALAGPFSDTFNSIFGRAESSDKMFRPHKPHHGGHHHPFPTGTGYPIPSGGFPTGGFPFPTGTKPGGPFPTESGGMNALPFPNPGLGLPVVSKKLSIQYELAPTSVVAQEKRQAFGTGIVPVMPPVQPTQTGDFPHPTGGFPHPTGGFPHPTGGFPHPTGGFPHPTGGFPTGGFPGIPTTLATFTRAPLPTGTDVPEFPGDDSENSWWEDWVDAWQAWYESHKGE